MLIKLSEKQQLVVDKIIGGANVAVVGSGGVGKSVIIKTITDYSTVVVAPTGMAALQIGGTTAHKAFGLPLGVPTLEDTMRASRKSTDLFNRYSPVKRIIIDEVSMLRTDMLELIDHKLQLIRNNSKPFGGLQVCVFGDWLQLPPIITSSEEKAFYSQYKSPYNFTSKSFIFETIELTEVFRQSDKRQVAMLNSIRRKDKYYRHALDTIIKESLPYTPSDNTTIICCYNKDVKRYNRKYFKRLDTPIFTYKARIETLKGEPDDWKQSVVPHNLELRVGAKVIFRCNDIGGEYVNGEKGEVVYLDNVCVIVKKDSGIEVEVCLNTWEKIEYKSKFGVLEKEPTSTFTQIPLALAYATSVHLVQGQTLDNIAIDVGDGCFDYGQLYVALSRCKDLKKVSFTKPPTYEDVRVNKEVIKFYEEIK